jgi:nucleotide-binding universal stress UspA family protein
MQYLTKIRSQIDYAHSDSLQAWRSLNKSKAMKKILVPCDFSRTAEEAFRFAVNIANKNNSEIHLLYVVDSASGSFSSEEISHIAAFNAFFMQKLGEQLKEKLHDLKSKYADPDCPVSLSIEIGSLSNNIQRYITEQKIDLVVMGTNGATGLKEIFVGSNTEKIVRTAKVPVVAVPLGSHINGVEDIVFPVDPCNDPTKFLKQLMLLQDLFQAKLQLLWINTPNIFKSDDEALADLKEFADEYHLQNYKMNIRSNHTEHEGILRFAWEINASLIFMPTHGRKGFAHWFGGSVTENVVNHVQCPVWTCSLKN